MKKIKLLSLLLVILGADLAKGQNLQLHYETDQNRQYPNAMLEDYRFDDWGATYWFVTMDFKDPDGSGSKSISSMYGEIARYINLPLSIPLSFTLQYNDGVYYEGSAAGAAGQVGAAWLTGVSYPLSLKNGSLQFDLLARFSQQFKETDGQITLVWFFPFGEGKLQFVGYVDSWTEMDTDGDKAIVILSEPQLWYTIWENVDLGVGGELDYNFPVFTDEEFTFYPNLSLRWNF